MTPCIVDIDFDRVTTIFAPAKGPKAAWLARDVNSVWAWREPGDPEDSDLIRILMYLHRRDPAAEEPDRGVRQGAAAGPLHPNLEGWAGGGFDNDPLDDALRGDADLRRAGEREGLSA